MQCTPCGARRHPAPRIHSSSTLASHIVTRAGQGAIPVVHWCACSVHLAHATTPPGGKGVLAEEEAQLLRLREEKEGQVRQELARARAELEAQGAETGAGKLCATPFGIDVVGITEAVALTGALVGGRSCMCGTVSTHQQHIGYAARQRKQELERLNEQLRKINLQLRQQARAGTLYAPGLTYVPPGGAPPASDDPAAELSSLAAAVAVAAAPPPPAPEPAVSMSASMYSMDEELESEEARQCLQALKEGKRFLKAENGASAMIRFEKALMLAKSLRNKVQERRAMRGLAAASRLAVGIGVLYCCGVFVVLLWCVCRVFVVCLLCAV